MKFLENQSTRSKVKMGKTYSIAISGPIVSFWKKYMAKNLIPTSQRRHSISITKNNHLMLFGGNNLYLF
jgi:predicted alpha/beta hydrolase